MMVKIEQEEAAWDSKSLYLSFGGEKGAIRFEIIGDDNFLIYEDAGVGHEWFYEDIDIDAARRLRDFLIYAVPGKVGDK